MDNDSFKRCLSQSHMKVTENEVEKLLEELDPNKAGKVNYKEFLKYSYLCQMFIKHLTLEYMLTQQDTTQKGLVTVGQLDEVL